MGVGSNPYFLWMLVEPPNFMRLSVKKVAHNCSRPVLRGRKYGDGRAAIDDSLGFTLDICIGFADELEISSLARQDGLFQSSPFDKLRAGSAGL